jgi:molecular chaperone Hsp33
MVTLDPRKRTASQQPWQGIVPFEGNAVSEILERYMARSEQVPTRLWLAADDQRAVGLLLQKLPEEGGHASADTDADGWNRLQHLADTLSPRDLLGLAPDEVIKRLFWQEPLHAFDRRDCRFECTCSRDKVGGMLKMLGAAEIESILEEQGQVEVRCDFCNEAWRLDAVDCARLFVSEPTGEAPPRQQ